MFKGRVGNQCRKSSKESSKRIVLKKGGLVEVGILAKEWKLLNGMGGPVRRVGQKRT